MTEITLYNTRTRQKEPFRPIDDRNVRMYVCGPTVYDRAHIGNARPAVVFDVLYRLLRHRYGPDHVTYVRNFTDVDDKIIDKAVAVLGPGETLEAATRRVTDETIGWYHDDMDALGVLRPTHEPRCTEYIAPMVEMTQALIDKGHAYEAEGHVLFAVETDPRYGQLSGRSVDDMIAGARVEIAPYKRSPMDFVIWKPSTDEQPGWDSPWGRGRPGWHIECSAMARDLLGEVFDIHAGGLDLQFPHHENELAQSCCAHGRDRMANWWLHNEMLRVEGEKMSKSLGNFFTARDLLDQGIPGEVVRFLLLSTHYRQPLDWTRERVEQAEETLGRWRLMVAKARKGWIQNDFTEFLSDDLNTAGAIGRMHEYAADGNHDALLGAGEMLGILTPELGEWYSPKTPEADKNPLIDKLIEFRALARANKDFKVSDEVRDQLAQLGVEVRDQKGGATIYLCHERAPQRILLSTVSKLRRQGADIEADFVAHLARRFGMKLSPGSFASSTNRNYNYEKAIEPFLLDMVNEYGVEK